MTDFIGKGWARDPKLVNGGVALLSGDEKIRQSIEIILGTRLGQRVMRPTFGSRLHELVFAPLSAETLGLAERYVTEALGFWEPRIDVLGVNAGVDPKKSGCVNITIRYRIKLSHDERSLVHPFYHIWNEYASY
jgi:phage baseplate assembly protein W